MCLDLRFEENENLNTLEKIRRDRNYWGFQSLKSRFKDLSKHHKKLFRYNILALFYGSIEMDKNGGLTFFSTL